MIPKEECVVVVTKEGYVKRVSLRSYDESIETLVKDGDYVIGKYKLSTLNTLLLFTNLGNFLYVPVYELPDLKWKELGKHISNIVKISAEEVLVGSFAVVDFSEERFITLFSKNGMIKRTALAEFQLSRYSKPVVAMKLKEDDQVIGVSDSKGIHVLITTLNGYGLRYEVSEVPVTGLKSSGVKAITLKNDEVVSGHIFDDQQEYLTVITHKGTGKRIKLSELEPISRARKGVQIIREVKTNPYYVLTTMVTSHKERLGIKTKEEISTMKLTELPIMDRYGTGSSIAKQPILDAFIETKLEEGKEETSIIEEINLDQIDEKIMTIDDFLDDFDLHEKK